MSKDVNKVVDIKGRIALGEKFSGQHYIVSYQPSGEIVLKPAVTIPVTEAWLWKNVQAMSMVQQGLEDLKAGKLVDKGSFSKFAEDEE